MKTLMAILACFASTISTLRASDIGQPLDCSDWVILEPGLVCEDMSYQCVPECWVSDDDRAIDNEGNVLGSRSHYISFPECFGALSRLEIFTLTASGRRVLAYVDDRTNGSLVDYVVPTSRFLRLRSGDGWPAIIRFDPLAGRLLINLGISGTDCTASSTFYSEGKLIALSGFTTLFEVQQTYAPAPPSVGFRVPVRPENLASVSRFDTYWGRVSDLPDFTQAQPMACAYPSDHQPQAGEYLTVADTSPRPPAGAANYIVTAASDGAQRRYGRQRIGASLTGRDPALLPSCP